MDSSLTLAQLQVLVAIADEQHVTRAGDRLGLSQPAVSHQLQRLERTLGLVLFERVGRGMRLTQDGRALLPLATAALGAARTVEEEAAAHRGLLAGHLVLAASNTIGVYRLPVWLSGFVERHPGVEMQVRLVNTAEAVAALGQGEVDAAFVEGPEVANDLFQLVVEIDELVVVAARSHPLAKLADRRAALEHELARHRYVAREAGSGTEALAASLLGTAYRAGSVLELGQVDAVRSAVLAGLGYAVLPLAAINEDLSSGRLVCLPTGGGGLRRELRALRRRNRPGPSLSAFWDYLTDLAAGPSAGQGVRRARSTPGHQRRPASAS